MDERQRKNKTTWQWVVSKKNHVCLTHSVTASTRLRAERNGANSSTQCVWCFRFGEYKLGVQQSGHMLYFRNIESLSSAKENWQQSHKACVTYFTWDSWFSFLFPPLGIWCNVTLIQQFVLVKSPVYPNSYLTLVSSSLDEGSDNDTTLELRNFYIFKWLRRKTKHCILN